MNNNTATNESEKISEKLIVENFRFNPSERYENERKNTFYALVHDLFVDHENILEKNKEYTYSEYKYNNIYVTILNLFPTSNSGINCDNNDTLTAWICDKKQTGTVALNKQCQYVIFYQRLDNTEPVYCQVCEETVNSGILGFKLLFCDFEFYCSNYKHHNFVPFPPKDILQHEENEPNEIKTNNYADNKFPIISWLTSIGLNEYGNIFVEQCIDNIPVIKSLTHDDLKELKINKLGHRKMFIIEAQKL